MTVPRFAFLGFGELAGSLAPALAAGAAEPPVVFSRRSDPARAAALDERIAAAGLRPAATAAEAVARADCVLACVPGGAVEELASAVASSLPAGALYADLATATPEAKERAAATVADAGARYVDGAVLGTVVASGAAVPILAAGAGAADFAALVTPLGMSVRAVDAPAGAATTVKLLRSVYMKGRDALVAEMMLAARRRGVDELVAASIAGPGEEVPFPQLAERVLASLVLHAGRRADELEASGDLLQQASVEPAATEGAVRRLRALAELDLAAAASGERLTAEQVLDLLERMSAR